MKTIIAGSRDVTDYKLVEKAIVDSGFDITEVICGCARGVDTLGEQWGKINNIPVKLFPADWTLYGKSAGYKRNVQMADNADALIAVSLNNSKGTGHMIDIAKNKGLKVFVVNV